MMRLYFLLKCIKRKSRREKLRKIRSELKKQAVNDGKLKIMS